MASGAKGVASLHRFFVNPDSIANHLVSFSKDEARHIERVLRLRPGDAVTVFDGSGWEFQVELLERSGEFLVGQVIDRYYMDRESPFKLSLVQGIAKGEKMDTIIQKAVEIGVNSIQPLMTERTIVQLEGQRLEKRSERWQHIAREACKQCRRNVVPSVLPVRDLVSFLKLTRGQPVLMLYEAERKASLKELLDQNTLPRERQPWHLLVGPEGGFSETEAQLAGDYGVQLVGLGPRILRTETAGLIAAGILLFELGDLG